MTRWRHFPAGPELSAEALRLDPSERPPRSISSADAAMDVERFFYLLEHGYCGYGYFGRRGSFDAARAAILQDLDAGERWSPEELVERIRHHLGFIVDCHLKLDRVTFAGHDDFWFAQNSVVPGQKVVSVNGTDPEAFLFDSLDEKGRAVTILGTLALSEPEPLRVETQEDGVVSAQSRRLHQSEYKGSELFRYFRLGGIPVVRIRTFSDHHTEQIDGFLQTADELRGEPCVIVDIRGNGGGNTRWPKEWIRRLTGQAPDLNQVLSELVSRTALVGQANYLAWLAAGPGSAISEQLERQREELYAEVERFDSQGARPYWGTAYVPPKQPIANETTIVVIIDRAVASSGEGLISYLQNQVENVVLVGENTRGALCFGHVTAHRLPHSKLIAFLPVKLNVPLDLEWREQHGFDPDYWVPAADALNRAVAAIRAGTIPTVKPLSQAVLETEFVPERLPIFTRAEVRRYLQIVAVILVGLVVGIANRKRGAALFVLLAAGLSVAGLVGFDGNPAARALALLLALVNATVAGDKLWRSRRRQES
jgi:hypothetical protein